MNEVILLSGSNLGHIDSNLKFAFGKLQDIGTIIKFSKVYSSQAWGFDSDNDFLNQCIKMETALKPVELLKALKEIEVKAGRVKNASGYEDRILDIDILFYEDKVIQEPGLEIPHPRLHLRAFTLYPLAEIAPDLIHPVFKLSIVELIKVCKDKNIPVALN